MSVNFDALEDIIKARKAKGLASWKKFEKVQSDLAGKSISDITFTTCYPGQEGQAKQLGSLSGNLQFLLGYVSPAFYVAPYHWRLVDMNLSDKDIRDKQHPANPHYWQESGLELTPEGDLSLGKPSPAAGSSLKLRAKVAAKKQGTQEIHSGYGTFVVDMEERVVYSKESGYIYSLDAVKNSFLYFENRELLEPVPEEDGTHKSLRSIRLDAFDTSVYPVLAKSLPYPGSVVKLEKFNVLVTPTSLHFLDKLGEPTEIRVFDRVYKSFDIRKGGDTHPSILLQFVDTYLADTSTARISLSELALDKAVKLETGDGSSRNVAYHDGHYLVV